MTKNRRASGLLVVYYFANPSRNAGYPNFRTPASLMFPFPLVKGFTAKAPDAASKASSRCKSKILVSTLNLWCAIGVPPALELFSHIKKYQERLPSEHHGYKDFLKLNHPNETSICSHHPPTLKMSSKIPTKKWGRRFHHRIIWPKHAPEWMLGTPRGIGARPPYASANNSLAQLLWFGRMRLDQTWLKSIKQWKFYELPGNGVLVLISTEVLSPPSHQQPLSNARQPRQRRAATFWAKPGNQKQLSKWKSLKFGKNPHRKEPGISSNFRESHV